MDTSQKLSASTITGFLQNEERNNARGKSARGRPSLKSRQPRYPKYSNQLYPAPPPGYYPFYPPSLPLEPTLSYMFIDFLKHFSNSEGDKNSPFNGFSSKNSSKECPNVVSRARTNEFEVNSSLCPNLCRTCVQHQRCKCCNVMLSAENRASNPYPQQLCCLHPPHRALQHEPHMRVLTCRCVCQQKEKIKIQKPKQMLCRNQCSQTLQYNRDNIPERDNPVYPAVSGDTCERTGCKSETYTYNLTDEIEQRGDEREELESDENTENESGLEVYGGEGDIRNVRYGTRKTEPRRASQTRLNSNRRPLAYFIAM